MLASIYSSAYLVSHFDLLQFRHLVYFFNFFDMHDNPKFHWLQAAGSRQQAAGIRPMLAFRPDCLIDSSPASKQPRWSRGVLQPHQLVSAKNPSNVGLLTCISSRGFNGSITEY